MGLTCSKKSEVNMNLNCDKFNRVQSKLSKSFNQSTKKNQAFNKTVSDNSKVIKQEKFKFGKGSGLLTINKLNMSNQMSNKNSFHSATTNISNMYQSSMGSPLNSSQKTQINFSESKNNLEKIDYQKVMIERFNSEIKNISEIDKQYIQNNKQKVYMAPEFNQKIYQKILIQEKSDHPQNYLKKCQESSDDVCVSSKTRDKAVCRIIELCVKRNYQFETLFSAIALFDKYFSENLQEIQKFDLYIVKLVTTVTLVAAKMEEPMQPVVNNMLKLLSNAEKQQITSRDIQLFEFKILNHLQFNVGLLTPLVFLERYLLLLNESNDEALKIVYELLIKAQMKSIFLDYQPSILAASTAILAIFIKNNNKIITKEAVKNIWNKQIQQLTQLKFNQINLCLKLMAILFTDTELQY